MRHRQRSSSKEERKLAQLCAQVEETVSFALGDAADERLRDLTVRSVAPCPDGARLLVAVATSQPLDLGSLEGLHAALDSARPWLRQQVAAEIHRKRTPDLAFQVLPPWEEAE